MQYYLEKTIAKIGEKIADVLAMKDPIHVELANTEVDADLAVPCFTFSDLLHMSPHDIAEKAAKHLQDDDILKAEAEGGYLNIWLKPPNLAEAVSIDFKQGQKYGTYDIGKGLTVISEFPSPNMAKPYSVGHLRPALQGSALYKLMLNMGYKVISDNHLGDYGTPFGKWAVGFKLYSSDQALEEKGIYELADVYIKITEALKLEKEQGKTELAEEVQDWLLRCRTSERYLTS